MAWLLLGVAVLLEVIGTLSLKPAGSGNVLAIVVAVAAYASSLALMTRVVQRLEIGVVYAVWAGLGTALVVLFGMAFFGESWSIVKLIGIVLVVAGVLTLHLVPAS